MKNNYFKITFWFGMVSILFTSMVIGLIGINLYPFIVDKIPLKQKVTDVIDTPLDTVIVYDTVTVNISTVKKIDSPQVKPNSVERKNTEPVKSQDTSKTQPKDTTLLKTP